MRFDLPAGELRVVLAPGPDAGPPSGDPRDCSHPCCSSPWRRWASPGPPSVVLQPWPLCSHRQKEAQTARTPILRESNTNLFCTSTSHPETPPSSKGKEPIMLRLGSPKMVTPTLL